MKEKMKKVLLAEGFAKAMNLLNHIRASMEEGKFSQREENAFTELATMLPEDVQSSFWNNGTLRGSEIS